MKSANIFRKNVHVGVLTKYDDGTFSFNYIENYIESEDAVSISVNFPVSSYVYKSEYLFAFFFNMLAEGNVKKAQCRSMKIDENDSFTRLLKTAKDDVIGSITVEEIL